MKKKTYFYIMLADQFYVLNSVGFNFNELGFSLNLYWL